MDNQIDNLPLWQILILALCGLGAIVSILSQFILAGIVRRLNRHGDKLENHQDRIIEVENNYKNSVLNAQSAFDDIGEGITEIKQGQKEQYTQISKQGDEIRTVDRRLTEFIIEYHKSK